MTIHPAWIRTKWLDPGRINYLDGVLKRYRLNTVCRQARCPNLGECFSRQHLTFIILGNRCTRNCRFCAVPNGLPEAVDLEEPARIALVVRMLALDQVIITSVTRDDLADGGALLFRQTITSLRKTVPGLTVEILTPDFNGSEESLEVILESPPDIWAHNLETVPRLYPEVRPQADYGRSLRLLKQIKRKNNDILTKSGIMLGLGEEPQEIFQLMEDLRHCAVDVMTLGQYLQPDELCLPLSRYVTPEEFRDYAAKAYQLGFKRVMSGPLVRSSFSVKGGGDERGKAS